MAEYASHALGVGGLTTGVIGTALGVLNGGANLMGGMGHGYGYGYANDIEHRIRDVEVMAEKDAMIASLQAQKYSDNSDIELYKQFRSDLNAALEPIKSDIKELQHNDREQAVYNAANNAAVTLIRSQTDELLRLTRRVIPNGSICPGWGEVTVNPVPAGTTTA